MGEFKSGKPYQKFIHFPKTSILTTKDNLSRLMKKMKVRINKNHFMLFRVILGIFITLLQLLLYYLMSIKSLLRNLLNLMKNKFGYASLQT